MLMMQAVLAGWHHTEVSMPLKPKTSFAPDTVVKHRELKIDDWWNERIVEVAAL